MSAHSVADTIAFAVVGKPWGEGVVLAMLPFITVGSILGIALSMILLPLSWVPCMPTVVGHTSSSLSLHIKAMWSVPVFIDTATTEIYTIFVFQVQRHRHNKFLPSVRS
eukprot:SAG11_NODE_1424_length_4949_cov_2.978763_5_plen_109_part_00